jgi:hypothetical protein
VVQPATARERHENHASGVVAGSLLWWRLS